MIKGLTIIQIELEFGNVGYWGEGEPEYPRKNLSEPSREPTTNSSPIWRLVRESGPGTHWWEVSAHTTAPTLFPWPLRQSSPPPRPLLPSVCPTVGPKVRKFSFLLFKAQNYLIPLALKFKMPLILLCSPPNLDHLSWCTYFSFLLVCWCVLYSLFLCLPLFFYVFFCL